MSDNATELIGTAEAATLLGKSHRTIHRLVESGALIPALVAPGGPKGAYMFTRADVQNIASEAAA